MAKKKKVKRKAKKAGAKATGQQRTLGDQRKAAESWIDKHVVTHIDESDFPELVNLFSYARGAFIRAVELVKYCKTKTNIELFVQTYMDLDVYLSKYMTLIEESPELLKAWPKNNRGMTFSKSAFYGWSALNVAIKYSLAVLSTLKSVRAEALGVHKSTWTKIVVSPEMDSRIMKWNDLAIQELNERIIPTGWEMYEINGEYGSRDDILQGEFEKAINKLEQNIEVSDLQTQLKKCNVGHKENTESIKKAFHRIRDELEIKPKHKKSGRRGAKYSKAQFDRIWAHGKDKLPPLKKNPNYKET